MVSEIAKKKIIKNNKLSHEKIKKIGGCKRWAQVTQEYKDVGTETRK